METGPEPPWRDLTILFLLIFLFPSSLLFSHQVVSNSLWLHGLQQPVFPCPSQSPKVCSNSCPLSQWCQPTISSSVVPFSFCPQSFPASGSFPVSWLFTSGGQSTGASASVLPMNNQGLFPLGLTDLISLMSKGLLESFSGPQFKSIHSLALSLPYGLTLTTVPDYWKSHSFDYTDLLYSALAKHFTFVKCMFRLITGLVLVLQKER